MNEPADELLVASYDSILRREDRSLSAAIRYHAQACGVTAFIFDVHPDRVAQAVRDEATVARKE